MASAVAPRASGLRPVMITRAPSSVRTEEKAAPRPRPAPVTTTVFPASPWTDIITSSPQRGDSSRLAELTESLEKLEQCDPGAVAMPPDQRIRLSNDLERYL